MGVKWYFLTTLFIFSIYVTLEKVSSASNEEQNEIEQFTEILTEPPVKPEPKKGPKLSAKQVLVLNQIIGGFTLDGARDPLCKNHTQVYKEALREFKPWAIKMFDASSKLQPGLLVGNTGEFGSFEECLQIFTSSEYGPIRGQMCTLKVIPGEKLTRSILKISNLPLQSFDKIISTLKFDTLWSVCLPDSCPVSDVERHFNRTLKSLTAGLDVTITLPENGCSSYKTEDKPFTNGQWIAIIFLSSIVVVVVFCTAYDILMTSYDNKNANKTLQIFSAYQNTKIIFSENSEAGGTELDCLNGIRSLSMCWVLIGHRYLTSMFVPLVNGLEVLNWTQTLLSTTVTGGTTSVDTFFMVSGMLVSYLFFGAMNKGVHFNLPLFYLHRYMRVTPVLGVVVLIYATVVEFWGSGPVWNKIVASIRDPCQKYWWSCLLHIQNYINAAEIVRHSLYTFMLKLTYFEGKSVTFNIKCVVQTWYLTCDMQYYFFSPVILYPLWKWPPFGWFLYFVALITTIGLNFQLAWVNEYNGGMPISNELLTLKYFTHHYTTPYTRASPYLLGIALGYFLYHTKENKVKINSAVAVIGWTASFATFGAISIGSLPFQELLHPYNRLESSIYLSLSRPAWTISLAWVVFNCINGTGGIINTFLSLYGFKVLAKLSYCMFLTHMILMFTFSGAEKTTYYFSNLNMWYMTFGDFALCFIASFFLAICVEIPIIRLDGLLRKKISNKKVEASK